MWIKLPFIELVLAIGIGFCLVGCMQSQDKVLLLENATSWERIDEPLVLEREQLKQMFGDIPKRKIIIITDSLGKPLASQMDDLDKNGVWDELAFVYSFQPKQVVKLKLMYADSNLAPDYVKRTNIRFAKQDGKGGYVEVIKETMPIEHDAVKTLQRYQLEGPGWENDKIGFRNYFDSRNAMDIFGKRSHSMVLDKIDLDEKVAEYMTMQPWGMDILKVAGSLGAGGLGMIEGDSLYRLTGAGTTNYELLLKGPVRSMFRLTYQGFKVKKDNYKVEQEISIWAGQPGYESKVRFYGFTGGRILIAGMANIKNDKAEAIDHNGIYRGLITHDRQSDSGDYLGMALLFHKKDDLGIGQAPKEGNGITQTWYNKFRLSNETPVSYWFIAGWEGEDPGYAESAYFKKTVQLAVDRLANPIKIEKL